MSFYCGCDDSDYETVSDEFQTATKPGKCCECGTEINPGDTEYVYAMAMLHEDDCFDDLEEDVLNAWLANPESDFKEYRHCERCGDLSLSVSDLGFCYSFGELIRSHKEYVQEMNNEMTEE